MVGAVGSTVPASLGTANGRPPGGETAYGSGAWSRRSSAPSIAEAPARIPTATGAPERGPCQDATGGGSGCSKSSLTRHCARGKRSSFDCRRTTQEPGTVHRGDHSAGQRWRRGDVAFPCSTAVAEKIAPKRCSSRRRCSRSCRRGGGGRPPAIAQRPTVVGKRQGRTREDQRAGGSRQELCTHRLAS